MKYVVKSYQNYQDEINLPTSNTKKIEFITATRALDVLIPPKAKILDCASGTGEYVFFYADKGFEVTALDIDPERIQYIEHELKNKDYTIQTGVNDATDLSSFDANSFDVVLCMGPIYHLTLKTLRDKCLSECIRVLKPGGLLVTSYINRFYVFPYIATNYGKYLNKNTAKALVETGVMKDSDPNGVWTDSYYSTPDEIEKDFQTFNLTTVDHLATDGLSPFLSSKINAMSIEEFKIWCDYHYAVCRERSILGASNHGLIIGRK